MADTFAPAHGQTVTTLETLYSKDTDAPFHDPTVMVQCDTGSAAELLVQVPEIHGTGANDFINIEVGNREYFRVGQGPGMFKITAKSAGTATASWGIVAVNR